MKGQWVFVGEGPSGGDVHRKYVHTFERSLLTLAIALFPFYVFPSGGVQPSHLVFFLLSLAVLLQYGIPNKAWLLLFALLSVYSFLVESLAGSFSGESRHLINPAFFLFNFMLMAGVYRMVLRHGIAVLRAGILVSAGIAVFSLYLGGVDMREVSEGGRPTGTFNNPNQLGYFSVCILSLSYLLYREKVISFSILLVLIGGSIFLSIASLSKAAMIANFAVLAFTLRPRGGGGAVFLWLVLTTLAGASAVWLVSSGHLDQFLFYDRIANMAQEADSSLVERGYLAFLDGSVMQVIFGLGSPEVVRIVGHEVHSTFAAMWNTYGIIGFGLFFSVFIIWARALYRAYGMGTMIALMAPAVLYGITHNGTRFSIFWLLVAASMGAAELRRLRLREERR